MNAIGQKPNQLPPNGLLGHYAFMNREAFSLTPYAAGTTPSHSKEAILCRGTADTSFNIVLRLEDGSFKTYPMQQASSTPSVVFGNNASGVYTQYPVSPTTTADHVVMRATNGQLLVPLTPTATNHAASKDYVDTAVAEAGGGATFEPYLVLYVSKTGNDANDGLEPESAMLTVQAAIDKACTEYISTVAQIHIGSGTYIENLKFWARTTVSLVPGNDGGDEAVVVLAPEGGPVVTVFAGAVADIAFMTFRGGLCSVREGGYLNVSDMKLGSHISNASNPCRFLVSGGRLELFFSTITGVGNNALNFITAEHGAYIRVWDLDSTVTSAWFAVFSGRYLSNLYYESSTKAAATGRRFSIGYGCKMISRATTANMPGNVDAGADASSQFNYVA